MFRGFENIMAGRGPLDGLVITPRVCGICTTSHLTAACRALDMITGARPTPDALRLRNLALLTEHIQSDMRHGFLMFAVDFANPAYQDNPLYEEAVRRYEPFRGETVIEVIRETKKVLGIVAVIGGQWPHSSYMVPGGVTSVPGPGDLLQCQLLLRQYRHWYERRILGSSLERWLEVRGKDDLGRWLEEDSRHENSDLGFFIRFALSAGLDQVGRGHGHFISYGSCEQPEGSEVACHPGQGRLVPHGFAKGGEVEAFDQVRIAEHVTYSWYQDYEGGRHPSDGLTRPYATGREGRKYSWAKAPRYDDHPAETGPLAEMIVAGNPLFTDLIRREGPSVFVRQLARLLRPITLIPAMETWIRETTPDGVFYNSPGEIYEGQGYGLTQATRGALGHWVKITDGAIERYQIITPTAWNASPRDSSGVRGPLEEALVGATVKDPQNPVELGHVVRSFDCCLVCTVHMVRAGGRRETRPLIIKP
ncbi:MAG: nickel-dependent hydrogenase large subunit [Thermodesulfobacteriota bacterium]